MEITNPSLNLAAQKPFAETLPGRIVLPIAASLFVALCAHAIVPLPFTPVPLTLSDLAVLMVGLALGPVAGFSALALYLLEGALGLPVFSPAGPGGIAQLLGPTGGYLIAYPFAAALAGSIFRVLSRGAIGQKSKYVAALIGCVCGSTLLMTSGVAWLGLAKHLLPGSAFMLGAAPFIPGQIIKVCAAAGIVTSIQSWRKR